MSIIVEGGIIRLDDRDFTGMVTGAIPMPDNDQPLLPQAFASVIEPTALFLVSFVTADRGWQHQIWIGAAGMVALLDIDGAQKELVTAEIDAMPGIVAAATTLGPRRPQGVRTPIPATVKGLQRLLEAEPAERAKRLRPFDADRLWVLDGTGFCPDGSIAAQESILVLDGPGGVWVPENGQVVPTTPTAVWTFLTAVLVQLSTAGAEPDPTQSPSVVGRAM
ncbi:hypothetical protein [Flexivirga caeni]|uniref:Uncharacterized protein n=1 Tax=Flexivirga caeni TaxID=2294115 RepID=A0A3M9M9P8_9MICO|nr:hypothetical protein [Flexivirga caeni]RNI22274.1 hypothetical protein EFY87_09900 [Flexivirga caeni]